MRRYKVGIIGCGRTGMLFDEDPKTLKPCSHAGAYNTFDNVDITAICDIRTDRLDNFKRKYGKVNTYHDYNEMLKKEELDIVSICTPSNIHSDICIKASENVKAIFCEKPIAMSLKEADQMIDSCERNNVLLAINHIRRWDNTYEKLKDIIEKNTYGKVDSCIGYSAPGLMNGGTHLFDIIRYIFGDIQSINGHIIKDESTDACGIGYLTLKDNLMCLLDISSKKYMRTGLEISTSEGIIENIGITRGEKHLIFRKGTDSKFESSIAEPTNITEIPTGLHTPPLVNAIKNILDYIDEDFGVYGLKCSGYDGKKAIEVAIAFHLSSYLDGKQVNLPLDVELGVVPRYTSYNQMGRFDYE